MRLYGGIKEGGDGWFGNPGFSDFILDCSIIFTFKETITFPLARFTKYMINPEPLGLKAEESKD
jgi:hypothetical protein